jgi:hypothetical protein
LPAVGYWLRFLNRLIRPSDPSFCVAAPMDYRAGL